MRTASAADAFRSLSLSERVALSCYLVGIFWRYRFVLVQHRVESSFYSDMLMYLERGMTAAQNPASYERTFVTHPPAMHYLTGWLYSLDPSMALASEFQFSISLFIPIAVAYLALVTGGRFASAIALTIASFYFPFVNYAAFLLTEIHVCLLFPLFLAVFIRWMDDERRGITIFYGVLSGLLLSLLFAFKAYFLPCAVFLIASYLLFSRGKPLRSRAFFSGVLTLAFLPTFIQLTIFCTRVRGELCFGTSKVGADFLQGHFGRGGMFVWNDQTLGKFAFWSPGAMNRGLSSETHLDFAFDDSRANFSAAWGWVKDHPLQAFVQSLEQISNAYLVGYPWPPKDGDLYTYNMAAHYFFLVFLLLPSILRLQSSGEKCGLAALLGSKDFLVFSPTIGLLASLFLATGESRYRIPLDGTYIVLASLYFASLFREKATKSSV